MTETRTTEDTTIDLLRKVAEDARDLIACNCGHRGNNWACEGSCTHGMAVRALQQLASATSPLAQLAEVRGTVSIDTGVATLPDGTTVDLTPAAAAAASASSWYLVTARLAFDDEDECFTLQATSMEDAMSQASDQLRERLDADEAGREDAREVYINFVVRCGATEPSIEKGAGQ